jgi:GT2 family glycosyltransferase
MISIIICSRNRDISEQLKSNIAATIGVPYEIIVIDNSKNDRSIFSAYNEGIRRVSFDYLCFMHEDIWYHSNDWGKSVIAHLSEPQTGLIGLAGSYYLLAMPSPWFKAKPYVKNQIQSDPTGQRAPKHYSITEDKEVICVDGFWFCARKNIFTQVSFDEKTFHNFHFYDLDISLQIHAKGFRIYAVSDIIVEHSSGGSFDNDWLTSAYTFYRKWEKMLPITVNPSLKKKKFVNVKASRDLLYLHKRNHQPISEETWKIGWKRLKFYLFIAYFLSILK